MEAELTEQIDIDSMPAGVEMDALVAERVMGCKPEPWLDSHGYKSYRCTCLLSYPHNSRTGPMADLDLKSYSGDIAAAWEVIERLRNEYQCAVWIFTCEGNFQKGDPRFTVTVGRWNNEKLERNWEETVSASTVPLAVCRAALKTVMK